MNALRQVSSPLILTPAYGRKYSSVDDMYTDFLDGKDFKIINGPYASIRDLEQMTEMSSSVWLEDGALSVRLS